LTTIITPIWLKIAYRKDESNNTTEIQKST
jgi:hypothetical protein